MTRDFRRFGSPYDPSYSGKGKIEKPQEQHPLRGCGDPNCAQCNPETANIGAPMSPTGRSTTSSRYSAMPNIRFDIESNPGSMDSLGNAFRDAARAMLASNLGIALDAEGESLRRMSSGGTVNDRQRGEPRRPPYSYQEARKAVEQWIVPAPEQAFDDIVGNEAALEGLKDAIRGPVEHKAIYEAYGLKAPRGALLSGPPGCGKTMFAKAAVSEMKRLYGKSTEFISISGSEIQSPYVGVTEGHITAVFKFAREYQAFHGHPLVVFIDEAEVLLPDRTGRVRRVAPWEESQVATFLAEMDGMKANGAFLLLATNRPEVIDQAVLRDGRCDFKIVVERPNTAALESILRKNFGRSAQLKDSIDDLVFAAVESFLDPARVIVEAHAIGFRDGKFSDIGGKNFTLEHIVSGAMAASVPTRAARFAFQRDKATGSVSGVTVADVLAAVNGIFEENRGLDHGFALEDFKAQFVKEINAKEAKK